MRVPRGLTPIDVFAIASAICLFASAIIYAAAH